MKRSEILSDRLPLRARVASVWICSEFFPNRDKNRTLLNRAFSHFFQHHDKSDFASRGSRLSASFGQPRAPASVCLSPATAHCQHFLPAALVLSAKTRHEARGFASTRHVAPERRNRVLRPSSAPTVLAAVPARWVDNLSQAGPRRTAASCRLTLLRLFSIFAICCGSSGGYRPSSQGSLPTSPTWTRAATRRSRSPR